MIARLFTNFFTEFLAVVAFCDLCLNRYLALLDAFKILVLPKYCFFFMFIACVFQTNPKLACWVLTSWNPCCYCFHFISLQHPAPIPPQKPPRASHPIWRGAPWRSPLWPRALPPQSSVSRFAHLFLLAQSWKNLYKQKMKEHLCPESQVTKQLANNFSKIIIHQSNTVQHWHFSNLNDKRPEMQKTVSTVRTLVIIFGLFVHPACAKSTVCC